MASQSPSGEVVWEVRDGIATVRLNRPGADNAFSIGLLRDLRLAVDAVEPDPEVQVIVFTGTGENFGTGGDIREKGMKPPREVYALVREHSMTLFHHLYEAPKPMIAAINGHAANAGVALALACDIRVASERARFSFHETKWGLMPSVGHCQLLPRVVGLGRAKELILTARTIDAREAERIGLVNRVVPHDEVLAAAYQVAAEILENAPLAIRQVKRAIDAGLDIRLALALDRESAALCYMSDDLVEGLTAFREGRKPRYQGR